MSSRLRTLNSRKISFFAFQDIITSVSGILILVTLILATELDRPTSQAAHDADPEMERRLSETLLQQVEVDARNQNLQELLAEAETAPAPEKLETDITRLRAQLAEEKQKHVTVAEQLAASQSAIEARDRTLGLTDLKAQIQRIIREAESLARQEAKVREQMAGLEQRIAVIQSKLLKLREREGKLWLIPDKRSTTKEPILVTVSAAGAKIERFDQPDKVRQLDKPSAESGFESFLREAKSFDQYVVFLIRPSGIELFDRLVRTARGSGFEVGFDALEEDKDIYFATPPIIDETTPTERRAGPLEHTGGGGYTEPGGGAGGVPVVGGRGRSGPSRSSGVTGSTTGAAGLGTTTTGSTAGGPRASARDGSALPTVAPPGKAAAGGQGTTSPAGEPGAAAGPNQGQASKSDRAERAAASAGVGDVGASATNGAGQDASVSMKSEQAKSTPVAKPAAPPPPKTKSWWRRLLEWIGIL